MLCVGAETGQESRLNQSCPPARWRGVGPAPSWALLRRGPCPVVGPAPSWALLRRGTCPIQANFVLIEDDLKRCFLTNIQQKEDEQNQCFL